MTNVISGVLWHDKLDLENSPCIRCLCRPEQGNVPHHDVIFVRPNSAPVEALLVDVCKLCVELLVRMKI